MWKTNAWAWAMVPALAVPFTLGNAGNEASGPAPQTNKLVRLQDAAEREPAASHGAQEFDASAWRERLSVKDLDARERAFDELVELGRSDADARRAVKGWARDDSAGELAWTSRLLLRQIDRPERGARRSTPPSTGFGGPGMDDLHRRMEELHRQFSGMDSLFGDLQRQMDDFQRVLPHSGFAPFGGGLAPGGPGAWQAHRGFSMQSGPDGVKVEIEEGEGDERHTKTYEAKSMEELLEAHPELAERLQGGSGWLRFPGLPGSAPPRGGRVPFGEPARPLDPGAAADESKLGIYVGEVGGGFAAEHGLEEGQGLKVESVIAGSLAERLGIRSGDVVVELDGEKLASADDVKRVLSERERGAELRCKVIDAKGRERKLSYTPKPAPERSKSRAKDADDGPRF